MPSRIELHELLILTLGSTHVYFQPPPSYLMTYPCIMYERSDATTEFADNNPYFHEIKYKLTVIDTDPDSLIPNAVARLPKCIFNRHYATNGLNHDVFTISF